MKNPAYDGETGLREPALKHAVAEFLRTDGYTVTIGKERERGPDIRATKQGRNLIIEAKGEGSRPEMFNNCFLNALGEMLQRRSMQAIDYGVALPAHAKYVRLIDELDDLSVRYHLRLNFHLVGKDGSEVGFLKCDVK